ncbi:MAG TPA: helix-turn-helix transcriptional regulator [Albitalea sp.]|nr:helix-turn-helix transcriptional regulator [Albitalea sp.]
MPAATPPVGHAVAVRLNAIGQRIRARRKALGVSATATSEAAGMSRVTLHRIERGEPSVTMGAYLGAIAALGLELELVDPHAVSAPARTSPRTTLPARIALAEYPQLKRLAWQLHGVSELTPQEALDLYERNWRHVDRDAMDARERELLKALVAEWGGGRLLV